MTHGRIERGPGRTPYALARCERELRRLAATDVSSIDHYIRADPAAAKHLLGSAVDTFQGMETRAYRKVLEVEGFEPLFDAPMSCGSTHGFGRKSDGVLAVFSQSAGRVTAGAAQFCATLAHGMRFDAGRAPDGYRARGGFRISFESMNGLRLKLDSLRGAPGHRLPHWCSPPPEPTEEPVAPGMVTMWDVADLAPKNQPRGVTSFLSGYVAASAETRRRMHKLPDEWKFRFDIKGERTYAEACRLSGAAP